MERSAGGIDQAGQQYVKLIGSLSKISTSRKRVFGGLYRRNCATLALACKCQGKAHTTRGFCDLSTLVDDLLAAGFENVSVLDVSAKALELAKQRLGERAAQVKWIEADITRTDLPEDTYALWHDRAVFHFLTQPADRQRYIETARCAAEERIGLK